MALVSPRGLRFGKAALSHRVVANCLVSGSATAHMRKSAAQGLDPAAAGEFSVNHVNSLRSV